MKTKVQKLYSIFSAKWYDPFKFVWDFFVSRKVNKEFENFLKHNVDDTKDVLELGCGTALNLQTIYKLDLNFKSYLGLDFSESMLKIAQKKFPNKENVEFKIKDITKLENLDKKYDVIICNWVLSHLNNPVEFVNNVQKHIKPDGAFFLIFYTKPKWYLRFWLSPIARIIFFVKSFDKKITKEFNNVKSIKTFTADLVTVVEIK